MSSNQPKVRVIIVNYNSGDWLARSVSSVLTHSEALLSVVDNASVDGSVALAQQQAPTKRVEWVVNQQNLGFAAANNQVLKRLDTDFVVLMNPDCQLNADVIEAILLAFSENPRLGLASCRILNQDGSIQATSRRRFPTPWSALVRMLKLQKLFPRHAAFQNFDYGDDESESRLEYVDAISGAFMVARRKAIDEVGLLDEAYFMHCEDLDWCKRFHLNDWQVGFVGGVSVLHEKGVSSRSRPIRVLWYLHKGMLRFFKKFYRDEYAFPLRCLVTLGVVVSFITRASLALSMALFKR